MGKGEIARYEQFLLFPQCCQKQSVVGVLKRVKGVKGYSPLVTSLFQSYEKETTIICFLLLCQRYSVDHGIPGSY